MALELVKLTGRVDQMSRNAAARERGQAQLSEDARAALQEHGRVAPELSQKIEDACRKDGTWRGARPLEGSLSDYQTPQRPHLPATLVAVDGSQIYPNRHGIALYYLLNVGAVLLRQGSGEAPRIETQPEVFFEESDLYDEGGRLVDPQALDRRRNCLEMATLVRLAESEVGASARPVLALSDGPLLRWSRPEGREARREADQELEQVTQQLGHLEQLGVVPLGYVDRPSSANVLRTLELAELAPEEVVRERLRRGRYRHLTDRLLFRDLAPNERSALFTSTSPANEHYRQRGQQIAFFYVNMARRTGPPNAIIARIELPVSVALDRRKVDIVQQALYADCALTGFPYVLARAHELAVVGSAERSQFEMILLQALLRQGLCPSNSAKANLKALTGKGRSSPR